MCGFSCGTRSSFLERDVAVDFSKRGKLVLGRQHLQLSSCLLYIFGSLLTLNYVNCWSACSIRTFPVTVNQNILPVIIKICLRLLKMAPKHTTLHFVNPLRPGAMFLCVSHSNPMSPERVLDDDVAVFKTRDWTNALWRVDQHSSKSNKFH